MSHTIAVSSLRSPLSVLIGNWDRCYMNAAHFLNQLPVSHSHRNALIGKVTEQFRRLDNFLSWIVGYQCHRYCGCEILEKGVDPAHAHRQLKAEWPTLKGRDVRWVPRSESSANNTASSLKGLAAVLFSWSFGCGHNVVQDALSGRLAEQGMHVYKVAADKEVLDRFDLLMKWTNRAYSTGDLINWLIRNQYWKTLRFLNWMFDKEKPESQQEKIDAFHNSIQLRGRPDIAITCFDRYVGAIEKAAHKERIPTLSFAADFAPGLSDIQQPSDVWNPHFIRSVMCPLSDSLTEAFRPVLKADQIQFGGLPVRSCFLKRYSPTEIDAFRTKWSVAEGKKVVILMGGGEGVENGYADFIFRQYRDGMTDVHLFVLCGKNRAQKEKLSIGFSGLSHRKITVTVLEWMGETQMGELAAMAGDDRQKGAAVSLKGGGGTISEMVAAGIPILVLDANPIKWEIENIDFICRNQLGLRFREEGEIVDRLDELLRMTYKPSVDYKGIDSKSLSVDLVRQLIRNCQRII